MLVIAVLLVVFGALCLLAWQVHRRQPRRFTQFKERDLPLEPQPRRTIAITGNAHTAQSLLAHTNPPFDRVYLLQQNTPPAQLTTGRLTPVLARDDRHVEPVLTRETDPKTLVVWLSSSHRQLPENFEPTCLKNRKYFSQHKTTHFIVAHRHFWTHGSIPLQTHPSRP